MNEVVITGAVRTPIGSFNGGLGSVSAVDLGTIAIKEALSRSSVSPDDVNEVIFGQVLTAGCGQNPARQSAVHAGIPASSSAVTVNQVCGSGLRTVAMAYQAISRMRLRLPHSKRPKLLKRPGSLSMRLCR